MLRTAVTVKMQRAKAAVLTDDIHRIVDVSVTFDLDVLHFELAYLEDHVRLGDFSFSNAVARLRALDSI